MRRSPPRRMVYRKKVSCDLIAKKQSLIRLVKLYTYALSVYIEKAEEIMYTKVKFVGIVGYIKEYYEE